MIFHYSSKGIITAVMTILLLYSCSEKRKPVTENTPKDYEVLTIKPHKAITYEDFPATIAGENLVEIRPMVDGYLEAIYVEEGATVKKDQLLFKIKNPMYEQAVITAEAAIQIALADVSAAEMDVEKVKPLVEKGIVSKYELESAKYVLQSKQAALNEAYATLANAKTNLGYTILRSPQNGVIASIPYKIGSLVSSTTANPLTTLSDIENVYAYFSLSEKQFLSFSRNIEGQTIDEKIDHMPSATLLLADGSKYAEKGKIRLASGLINTETGSASFKAVFPNPTGIIRSGASGTIRLPDSVDSALLVPQNTSYEMQDKRFVYTLTAENRIKSTAITTRPTDDGQFFIVLSGLKKGDRVVINGFGLKDNILIIPKSINADSLYKLVNMN